MRIMLLLVSLLGGCAGALGDAGPDAAPILGDDDDVVLTPDASADAWSDPLHGWQSLPGLPAADPWPALVVGADGEPVVAVVQQASIDPIMQTILVFRWDGSAWQQLGTPQTISGGQGATFLPDLTLAQDGSLLLSFTDQTASQEGGGYHAVYAVRRWSGTSWEAVGSAVEEPYTIATWSAVAATSTGQVWLAVQHYSEATQRKQLVAYRLVDNGWEPHPEVDPYDQELVESNFPDLVAGSNGQLFLAWVSQSGLIGHAAAWDGSSWDVLPSIVPPGGYHNLDHRALALQDGQPIFSFSSAAQEGNVPSEAFVTRWSGSAWSLMTPPLSAVPGNTWVNAVGVVAVPGASDLVVAWAEDGAIQVQRCAGGCAPVGRGRLEVGRQLDGSSARLAMDPHGRPVLAWVDGSRTLQLWRYHGDPDL